MNEKDQDLAGGVVYQINKERKGHQMGDCAGEKCPDWITRQVEIVTTALTTTRKEAREAAWKKAIKVVEAVHRNTMGSVSDWQVLGPLESAMKKDLEAAGKEGGGDG